MVKRAPNRANQAATREAAARRRAAADRSNGLLDLSRIARDLDELEVRRLEVVARRDALVRRLLTLEVPMAEIARHTGLSRQALMKRL